MQLFSHVLVNDKSRLEVFLFLFRQDFESITYRDGKNPQVPQVLLQRASSRGHHYYVLKTDYKIQKSVTYKEVDLDRLIRALQVTN